jgi:hypothetical protein
MSLPNNIYDMDVRAEDVVDSLLKQINELSRKLAICEAAFAAAHAVNEQLLQQQQDLVKKGE